LRVDGFLSFYERLCYGFLERVCSHELALATTAAMEHYTAIMAENALRNGLLAPAHPTMRAFLHWHAAEEIEHRAVAFDVLAATDDRYALRAAGMAMATALLGLLWAVGAATLIAQDLPPARELPRELRRAAAVLGERRSIVRRVFLRGLREYLRPGFHPDEKPLDDLAAAALAELGLATAEEAAA
ncbi:MAG: metal-dependent hydrolase, partial [Myxococcales bacterium]|nr:metal-dependent hydrolase [Myxococcales bacterium]